MLAVEVRLLGSIVSPTTCSQVNRPSLWVGFLTCKIRITGCPLHKVLGATISITLSCRKPSPQPSSGLSLAPAVASTPAHVTLSRNCVCACLPLPGWELFGGRNRIWFCSDQQRVKGKGMNRKGELVCPRELLTPQHSDPYALMVSPLCPQICASREDAYAPGASGRHGHLPGPAGGNCHEC